MTGTFHCPEENTWYHYDVIHNVSHVIPGDEEIHVMCTSLVKHLFGYLGLVIYSEWVGLFTGISPYPPTTNKVSSPLLLKGRIPQPHFLIGRLSGGLCSDMIIITT